MPARGDAVPSHSVAFVGMDRTPAETFEAFGTISKAFLDCFSTSTRACMQLIPRKQGTDMS